MDRTELINKLDGFRQACSEIGCINVDNKKALDLEEAYPGAEPTSYIINIIVKQEWLDRERLISPLRELIDLFYEKADIESRKNILTLRICGVEDSNSIELLQKEAA